MTDDNSSIAEQLETVTTAAAEQGYGLRRKQRPPYGWELHIGDTAVTFGSLDQLERYLRPHRNDSVTVRRVDAALRGEN